MKRPVKPKKNRRGESPEPAKFSRKDLLQMWGIIVLILGIVVGLIVARISYEKAAFAKSLIRTIDGWRETYHLSDEQARRIREIEFAFHGTGNRLMKPSHTREESVAHHATVAAVMNTDDGVRFLKEMSHP